MGFQGIKTSLAHTQFDFDFKKNPECFSHHRQRTTAVLWRLEWRVVVVGACLGQRQGLSFWLAGPQHFQEIMSISEDIYWGNDYLPHRYHSWMGQPNRAVILARRGQALLINYIPESAVVVDGGETLVVEALRVAPEERGRGVAGIIQSFTDAYMRKSFPGIQRTRLTRSDDPGEGNLIMLNKRGSEVCLSTSTAEATIMVTILYDTSMTEQSLRTQKGQFDVFLSHLRARLREEEVRGDVYRLQGDDLTSVLLDPSLSGQVSLPAGCIIQDWLPLQPIPSNFHLLHRPDLTWLADRPHSPAFLSLHTRPYPIPYGGGGLLLSVDLFGSSLASAKQALTRHLESARGDVHRAVLVHVFMHGSLLEGMAAFCEGDAVQRFKNVFY
ncbi:histidine N-acetyltransferase-like [Aplochiton taeniatus]